MAPTLSMKGENQVLEAELQACDWEQVFTAEGFQPSSRQMKENKIPKREDGSNEYAV